MAKLTKMFLRDQPRTIFRNIDFTRRSLAKWLERLAVNAKVATALGSIPASSDTVEAERWQMKKCLIT